MNIVAVRPVHTQFIAAGTVVGVDAVAGTLTFAIHGGRDKARRGQLLTVPVTEATLIRRHDLSAGLGDLSAGDHVNVKGSQSGTSYVLAR